MVHGRVGFSKWIGLCGAAVLLLTGCPEDAVDIVEPKATILDFPVAPLGLIRFPTGSVNLDRLALAQFDETVDDAFGRETGRDYGLADGAGEWIFGNPFVRVQDARAPTLVATDPITATSAGLLIDGPAIEATSPDFCAGPFCGFYFFIISGALEGLPPSTPFTVALVRLGTDVKGELDQAAILQGEPVTQPDSLVILNPNPGGDPTVILGVGGATVNRGDTINVVAGANPLIVGNASSDATGVSDFGIVIRCDDAGGTPVFYCDNSDPVPDAALGDSVMSGRNDGAPYGLPRYNYVVLYEGVGIPTDATRQIARWQVGQDLDLNGQPLNNGAAPFPAAAFTIPELIAAPGGAGRPDSVTVDLLNLESLAGGAVWQAWLFNRETETMLPATSTYQRVAILREINEITGEIISERDSTLESVSSSSSFAGELEADLGEPWGVQEIKHRLVISDNTAGGGDNIPGLFTDVVVSSEAAPGATSPSAATALWLQYTDQGGTPDNFFDDVSAGGTLAFGHFDLESPSASRVSTATGFAQSSGLGGILAVDTNLVEVSVDIRNLPLPPPGFYYEGWLYDAETGNATSMGPITSLPPDTVSLLDADADPSLPGVTATGIRFANAHVALDDPAAIVGPEGSANLSLFFLTLEAKLGGDTKNVADLEVGALPIEAIVARLQARRQQ